MNTQPHDHIVKSYDEEQHRLHNEILRMGEIQKRVVVIDVNGEDGMAIHPVMYAALSYDHRVVDGALANAFLWRISEILEKGEFEV